MTIEIPLTKGQVAIVDDVDSDLIKFKWCCSYYGYAVRAESAARIYLHREILERKLGRKLKPKELSDHRNRNRLDNRRGNLRLANRSQNRYNEGLRKNTNTPYKGVSYRKEKKKWRSYIKIDGKYRHLGHFDSPEQAAKAYDSAAAHFFGEYACLNFPDNVTPFSSFPKPPKPSSNYQGVFYAKDRKKWRAYIKIGKKQVRLGQFESEQEAAKAYDKAALEHHDDDAKLNFPK